jgi:hypothetical protein
MNEILSIKLKKRRSQKHVKYSLWSMFWLSTVSVTCGQEQTRNMYRRIRYFERSNIHIAFVTEYCNNYSMSYFCYFLTTPM